MSDTATETPALESGAHQRMLDGLTRELGDGLLEHAFLPNDLVVRIDNPSWHKAIEVAKRQLGLTFFSFLAGIDWLPAPNLDGTKAFGGEAAGDDDEDAEGGDEAAEAEVVDDAPTEMVTGVAGGATRFQVFCRLEDIRRHAGMTFKVDLADADPRVASIVDVFRGADWHERETWEMYGFEFDGHPGLRHLYLPGEFEGHPLRKDFPLLARELKPWPGLVNVEQIPDHLDPKKIAEREAEAAAALEPAPAADEPAAEAEAPKEDG